MSLNLAYVSDVHLEFYRDFHDGWRALTDKIPSGLADVLVLAGDIVQFAAFDRSELDEIFAEFRRKAPVVVYVPGNHEFYGQSIEDTLKDISSLSSDGLVVLDAGDDKIFEHLGRRFIGCTLWFPYRRDNHMHEKYLSDFSLISPGSRFQERRGRRRFDEWVYEEHERQKGFLLKSVGEGDVLVTHHLPGHMSVPAVYMECELNRFFVADAESVAEQRKPALWIHGHTHSTCDYRLFGTRVLCNAAGYPSRSGAVEVKGWDPAKIVEI